MDVVIKKEKDDGGSASHGSWLDLAVDNRTCEWCSAPYDMRAQLPNYVEVPLDDWHKDLVLDLCYCFDCVQEYHRLQDELDYDSRKILYSVDIQRLAKTIVHALNNAGEGEVLQDIATHLQVPLLEILKFPYLLHHKQLAGLFARGLIALNVCGCPLKLEDLGEKLPGTYLLLVHHDPEVRGWAVRSVRGQGLINQDDYDVLKQVIGWMIEVVEFNLFEYSDIMTSESELFEHTSLPAHIFIQLTIKEYWLSLFVLLRQMDVDTMQSCFMSFTGHHEFLNIIVLPMANQEPVEDDGAFWPRLQCFIVLLERLGIKNIWQISVHKPDQLFTIITENYSFHNAVMQWQNNEDEEASSQEIFGDLRETRIVSGSSDTKHFSRFYKTALAWFQPFVQSVLDFDSHNNCVSHVIDYLHNLAGGCSHENIFKSDVLSVLLSIIHQLLAKRKFELLLPTVHIWAIDVVDVVIFELGDKKIVEGTRRLLQHLLKDMHRRGHWRALKHWQKFSLPGRKQLSTEDQQEIVSLLVQSFEAQHKAPVVDFSCSKASLVLPYGRSKAPVSFGSPVPLSTKAPMAHSRHGTKAEWLTKSKDELHSKTSFQSSLQTQQNLLVKGVKVENSSSVGNVDCLASENRGKAPHSKLQSYEKPGPSTRSTSSEDEETGFWPYKKRNKNADCLASDNRSKAPHGKLQSYEEPGPSTQASSSEDEETGFWPYKKRYKNTDCFASDNRSKAAHGKLRSDEEPGPSAQTSSSEDEETGFWSCKKRDKKPKHPSEEVEISKSAQRLKGTPIYAKLQLEDCKTSILKVKTETSIGERAYQGITQPKKRHKARKSAGMIKKHTPIHQSSGATLDDPIVLSDDDEDATEPPEQNKQTSTRDKGAGILDDYSYYNNSENHEVTLLQLKDEYDSPPRAVETSSKVQDTVASRSLEDSSSNSEPNSSDEELLTSYMESKNKNVTSVEPSEHHSVSQVKTEKTDFNTAYSTSLNDVLHEGGDMVDYDNESDDFALPRARTLESRAKTKPVSGIRWETISNSSGKADLSSDSDDEPLSSVAARSASKSTHLKTSARGVVSKIKNEEMLSKSKTPSSNEVTVSNSSGKADLSSDSDDEPLSSGAAGRASKSAHLKTSARGVVSKIKNEEMLSESKTPSSNEVINTTFQDTSAHKKHFRQIETEPECSYSLFADANEITHEVDYFNNVNSDVENHEMEIQTVKPEPAEEGEDRFSFCSISKQLENENFIDDSWDDYGYSELVVNSQENALARVEEDLDDVYSTQIENVEENETIKSSPYTNEAAFPDEAPPKAKPSKRVSFADDTNSANTVVGRRPSVSQAANTKPTRALSEDVLFHEILNWKAERLCKLQSNNRPACLPRDNLSVQRVPNFFESMDAYYKTFKPLLLVEIWEQAIKSWWDKHLNRKSVVMDVLDGSNVNSFWLIPCKGIISENQHRNVFFPLESELVLLTLVATNERGGSNEQSFSGQSVFGFVEKADARRVQSSRKVSVGSSGGDDEPKFQLTLNIKTACNFRPVRNCRIRVEYVYSLLTALRQWGGLRHLSKSILASDILRPRKADYFCSVDYSQSSHVAKEYNESQEKVISTAANAVYKPFPIPRICLVQGPPGTGKSFTIVGLVKEILNRAQQNPPPTMSGPSNGSLANKVRILLCAPSNAAIDELIVRIRKAQIQLDKRHDNKENMRRNGQNAVKSAFSNNCGDLCLVRVGRKSLIHPSVMKFSLESMTKQIVENASTSTEDNLIGIKEKLQSIAADEKKLQHEIWMLQTAPQSNACELEKLESEKAKLIKLKNTLELQYRREKDKEANKRREQSRIRKEILQCADVICTTLSGAGSSSLKQDLAGRRVCPFTCVIVDEACQCNELDLLIPLWFQASKLVLVGDPEQLPSTIMSMKAKENLYGRSMFERLYKFFRHNKGEMGKPVLMLEEQYRMHPEIAAFPSSHVYNNWLKSHSSLERRPFPLAKHYALFDVLRGGEISQDGGALSNPTEVDLIVTLCRDLAKILHVECVGIITPYRQQKGEIQKRLMDEGLSRSEATIEVNTVDGFQGREKDVIILSCVRAQNYAGSIGFLSNRQRMNVALTRARHALYVFGHMRTLKRGSPDWQALIDDADKRHCLFPVESPRNVRSVLSIGLTKDIRSPAKDPRTKTKHISAQVSDFHGNGSTINDYDVHQMDTSLAVSCSGSAVERSEGHVTPVSTCGKDPSVTAERRAHTTAAAEMASEPLPGNGQRDGHAAESRKMVVNSSHSTKQAQENHGKEGVRYRDRHQKETMEAPRHRPRSDDHRSDLRRHGNRDSRERDRNHRNHHRQEQKNGAPVESKSNQPQREHARYHSSHRNRDRNCDRDYDHRDRDHDRDRDCERIESKSNHTQTEFARYHSSHRNRDRNCDRDYDHRDRDHDRDRDCERIEGSAFQERQTEPGQNRMRLDTRFPSTITTFDEDEVCKSEDEIHCSDNLEIDTQDPHFISLLEYNGAHNMEYFCKLHQQERQSSKSVASSVESGWSPPEYEFTSAENDFPPAETTAESLHETTSNRVPYPMVQPGYKTTVSGMSNVEASTRVEKAISQSSNPGVSDTLNSLSTGITTQHRSSTYSSAAPLPSTSNATNPNALSGRTSTASSFSLSSGLDISQPSTSSGCNRSLNGRESRSELSPDAQIASDKVRQRNPPAKGTQEIPFSSVGMLFPHGGSRKRKAHADSRDDRPLRQRATSGGSAPSRRSAIGATKNTIQKHRKEFAKIVRGRKNWK